MKFQCNDCGRQFLYAATTKFFPEGFTQLGTMVVIPETQTEFRVCPYCGSIDFDEFVEADSKEVIISLKDVSHGEVDEWLQKGYKVHTIYAKNSILTKSEAKTE